MKISQVDLANDTDVLLLAQLLHARTAESGEDTSRFVADDAVRRLRSQSPTHVELYWLARDADGQGLGVGSAYWYRGEANTDMAFTQVWVRPAARGRGVGRTLFAAVLAALPPQRTRILSYVVSDPADGPLATSQAPGPRFARALGLRVGELCHVRRHPWPTSAALLDSLDPATLAADGTRRVGDYTIEVYINGVAPELQEDVARLHGMVEAEVEAGDIDYEPEPFTAADYRDAIARAETNGTRRVEAVAVWVDAAGRRRAVGVSSYAVPSQPDANIEVLETLVEREHRGHRLGWAVKCAVERQLLALELPHPAVNTCNADENAYMLAINDALGFREVLQLADLIGERAEIEQRLAAGR